MGLWVGPSGCGKTVGIGSMPGPVLIFDFEDGIAPLINFYPRRTDIEYYTVGLSDDARQDVIGFMTFCKKFENLQDDCRYGTVAIDSYTMMSVVSVLYNMGHRDNKALKRTKGGIPIPDWDEFKGETNAAIQVMEVAKSLPCHFVMTGHPIMRTITTKQGGDTNETLSSMIRTTSLSTYGSKTPSFLPCYFNEMYHFYTEASHQVGQKVHRYVQTVSAGDVIAKSAMGLPPVFEITDKALWSILENLIKERVDVINKLRGENDVSKGAA